MQLMVPPPPFIVISKLSIEERAYAKNTNNIRVTGVRRACRSMGFQV